MSGIHLVTGGLGFIGSHLVKELIRRGRDVRVIDNCRTGNSSNIAATNYDLYLGDICLEKHVRNAMDGVTHVYHLAAEISVEESILSPSKTLVVNTDGTHNVLKIASEHKVERFVFASSAAAASPASMYGLTKKHGEELCWLYTNLYKLPTVSLRFFNVFGPRQTTGGYCPVIPSFIKSVIKGDNPTIYGSGDHTRDFVYVDTVVRAIINAATLRDAIGKTIEVGSGERKSVRKLLTDICQAMRSDISVTLAPARDGEISDSQADISNMERLLGVRPDDFISSLESTINYYKGAV